MQPNEYIRLSDFERWYWWYLAQRENLLQTILALPLPQCPRVLDAGCGTGLNLRALARRRPVRACGLDASCHAEPFWKPSETHGPSDGEVTASSTIHFCRGSINDLPYRNDTFDLVFSLDVLDCEGVDPKAALRELSRVVRPGGHVVLYVPAYQWMRSRHDRAVRSARRFSRGPLIELVRQAGLSVRRSSHLFASLLPVIAAVRLGARLGHRQAEAASDLRRLPAWLNGLLLSISRMEQVVGRRVPLPFGSTIQLWGCKNAP